VTLPDSYWVEPRLLAGEYPGSYDNNAEAALRLDALREAGVTSFVDLTEEGELAAYQPLLRAGVRYRRVGVRDFSCPSEEEMRAILDLLDAEVARGETVYLHCWGGVGRTGTVIGCWLARHGLSGDVALGRLRELRSASGKAGRDSPETDEPRALVRSWTRDA
jgi:predicted protein tyrosine phosphatase